MFLRQQHHKMQLRNAGQNFESWEMPFKAQIIFAKQQIAFERVVIHHQIFNRRGNHNLIKQFFDVFRENFTLLVARNRGNVAPLFGNDRRGNDFKQFIF